jgi:hypothetical protein
MAAEALIEPYLEAIRVEIAFANRDAGALSCNLKDLVLLNAEYGLGTLLSIPTAQNSDLLYYILPPFRERSNIRSDAALTITKAAYPRNGSKDVKMLASSPHTRKLPSSCMSWSA